MKKTITLKELLHSKAAKIPSDYTIGFYGPFWTAIVQVEKEDGSIVWATLSLAAKDMSVQQPYYNTLKDAITEERKILLEHTTDEDDRCVYAFKDKYSFFRTAASDDMLYDAIVIDFEE